MARRMTPIQKRSITTTPSQPIRPKDHIMIRPFLSCHSCETADADCSRGGERWYPPPRASHRIDWQDQEAMRDSVKNRSRLGHAWLIMRGHAYGATGSVKVKTLP